MTTIKNNVTNIRPKLVADASEVSIATNYSNNQPISDASLGIKYSGVPAYNTFYLRPDDSWRVPNETPAQRAKAKMTNPTREEIDAKIDASDAKTDTKFARLEGKMDIIISKIENSQNDVKSKFDSLKDDNRAIRANQWVIGFGLAVLIVAIVALFPVFFGIGVQIKDLVDHEIEKHSAEIKK